MRNRYLERKRSRSRDYGMHPRRGRMMEDYRGDDYRMYPNEDYQREYMDDSYRYRGDYRGSDYRGDYRGSDYRGSDYRGGGRYDYRSEDDDDEEYKTELKEKCKELERYDKFKLPKNEILEKAKQMGIKFDKFDEEELLFTYYMMMSDYDIDVLNSPHIYLAMASKFLDDKDAKLQGTEKLAAYLDVIVDGNI